MMHCRGISSCTVCASESIQGLALYTGILSILKGKVTTVSYATNVVSTADSVAAGSVAVPAVEPPRSGEMASHGSDAG